MFDDHWGSWGVLAIFGYIVFDSIPSKYILGVFDMNDNYGHT
jgi:hypothetical protein